MRDNMTLDLFTVHENDTIINSLKKIDHNKNGFLIVLNDFNQVTGTLTDGDIRRFLIYDHDLSQKVINASNKKFSSLCLDAAFDDVMTVFKNESLDFLPVVDAEDNLFNIITKKHMHVLLLSDMDFDIAFNFFELDSNLLEHEIYNRPWGFYKTTFLNDYSQSKIIKVYPSQQLSLQRHRHREEYWVVINGQGEVTLEDSVKPIQAGSYIFIPKGTKHMLKNTSDKKSLMLTEVQLGDYFGEDDIIRLSDKYGRR